MACDHLRKLIQLCDENELRFSSSDLLHLVCKQCEREEVCPSMLLDRHVAEDGESESSESESGGKSMPVNQETES